MSWHRLFFWILLLFLPTQLGVHVWPDWAMVLGRRVDYLSPTVFLTDILLLATLLFWLFERLSRIKNYEFRIKGVTNFFLFPFILYSLFFILIGANIYGAANRMVALYRWGKVAEFVALGWYIVKTKPSFASVVFPLSIGVLHSSVLAIFQFLLQHSVGGPLWFLGERTFTIDTPGIARINACLLSHVSCPLLLRPYATFPHPNVLGGFLAVTIPLLIFNLPRRQAGFQFSIFKMTTIVLGVITLFLTFSRSAIVVGVIGILLAFRKKMLSIVIVLGVIFFFILNSQFSLPRRPASPNRGEQAGILNSHEESLVVRQQLNMAAIIMWQQSPLVGIGLGNFLVELPKALPSRSVYFLQPVHNIYLLILAETGFVGLVFFAWLVYYCLRHVTRDMRQGENKGAIFHVACRMSLVSLLALGLIDHYPLTLQQGQLLLTLFVSLNLVANPRKIDT